MTASQKLILPTGYESQQREVERRRSYADRLLAMSDATQQQQMRSWSQPIAALVQAFMASRQRKKADQMETDYRNQMKADYNQNREALMSEAAAGSSLEGLVNKFGNNPWLEDDLKPIREAYAARLKADQNLIRDGDTWRREGQITPGDLVGNKATDAVIRDAEGNMVVNPVAATAAMAGAGVPLDESTPGVYSMQDPRSQNALAAQEYLNPPAAPATANENEYPYTMIDGKPYWQINGKWYDNPEGR